MAEIKARNLWLTRNRHGAGFWDRKHISPEADAALDRLTEAAHAEGNEDLIVIDGGDDRGKVGVM